MRTLSTSPTPGMEGSSGWPRPRSHWDLYGHACTCICCGIQLTLLQEVARYLEEIVPPVLACFSDSDARVRYYACESMYNIAKVAKGEILIYFNQVFDALCKVSSMSAPIKRQTADTGHAACRRL